MNGRTGLDYRRDIDGLRAVAVTLVVLYHAGVPGFAGGYIGVDVFFVISGYLIASIIVGEITDGRFSLLTFYERRARRLFPALFVVIAACLVAGYALTLPSEFAALAAGSIATLAFISNLYFWQQTGYFATGGADNPLLHTWSLAVEEQFYLVFPILCLVALARGRRTLVVSLAIVTVISFGLSAWATTNYPSASFYLPPTRAWELSAGALLALTSNGVTSESLKARTAGWFGLAVIVWSALTYSAVTPFPGIAAAAPVLGAVLVIRGGSRLLATFPFVFVGLISYSLYLWHRPLLVFTDIASYGVFDPWMRIGAVGASFILASITWRFVERPFRGDFDTVVTRRQAKLGVLAGLILLIGAVSVLSTSGLPSRVPERVRTADQVAIDNMELRARCMVVDPEIFDPSQWCILGPGHTSTRWVIWGDSHALVLTPAVEAAALSVGGSLQSFSMSSCPPLPGTGSDTCDRFNDRVVRYLEGAEASVVILAGRWTNYISPSNNRFVPKILAEGVSATVRRLEQAGKSVILVAPIPEAVIEVPASVARARMAGARDPTGISLARHRDANRFVLELFAQLDSSYERVQVVDPSVTLCAIGTCTIQIDGVPIYYDRHHLTRDGSLRLTPLFIRSE